MSRWAAGAPLKTVFVGGGTPTLLQVELWRDLLRCLQERFDCSALLDGKGEFTVECNPETATSELFDVLRQGGVSRISIGAQSFNTTHLKTLERRHDPANVPRALELARSVGIRQQSIDLIYAIPGQTIDDWDSDLRTALSLGLSHLSCYALTYEPDTAMTARLKRGEFPRADEDLEADMFEHTLRTLRDAGLDRYEVSNFAAPGNECAHNMVYWRQGQWLAAGPSASAHVAGHRWKNVSRLDDYLTRDDMGFAPHVDLEPPDARRAITERILTGLRLREGLDTRTLLQDCAEVSPHARERVARALDAQRGFGNLHDDAARARLTDSGFLVADRVILALVEALDG